MAITQISPRDLDLETYPAAHGSGPRPGVLVLPGGGFREHTRHDGEGYARWLSRLGMHAVVLNYRLRPDPFPRAIAEARAALGMVRAGLGGMAVDSSRVGVIGSSAGGLLAGLLATGAVLSVETGNDQFEDERPPRPSFHIQSYGLADLDLLPESAVANLLGERADLKDELSPARWVDARTSPTFVWATAHDPPGLPNALEWARVLSEHEVPVELHVYPQGWHGVGLADGVAYGPHGHESIPNTARWTEACEQWLRHRAIL